MKHLIDGFTQRCAKDAGNTAFLVKQDGKWHPVTLSEADQQSDVKAEAWLVRFAFRYARATRLGPLQWVNLAVWIDAVSA